MSKILYDADTRYVVKDGHTLGYIKAQQPNVMGVLVGSVLRGGHDWQCGPVRIFEGDDIRDATRADFESFRVAVPPDLAAGGSPTMKRGTTPTAEQVKAARTKYGFTQTQAGALVYYTLSGWQRIEQGERELHPAIWEYWQIRAKEAAANLKQQREQQRCK